MLSLPPSYSTLPIQEPPDYSTIIINISNPPAYSAPTNSVQINHPVVAEHRLVQEHHNNQSIEKWCSVIWIILLMLLASLHITLAIITGKCALPETSLNSIRAFFSLHSFFLVGIVIYCYYKCVSENALTYKNCLVATFVYAAIPLAINMIIFFSYISDDIFQLNIVIQRPSSVPNTYACSLLFYRLIFGLTLFSYIGGLIYIIATVICYINRWPRCLRHVFKL